MTGQPSSQGTGERFRKQDRLRKRGEYLAVQQRGRKLHLEHLLAFILANGGRGRRVGVTVSAKVGNAVERNRLKRLLREVWRRERSQLPDDYDVVFVAKKSATAAGYEDVRRQVVELGRRLARQS